MNIRTLHLIPKHSSVPNKVPQASQLMLGELAINTADGRLYTKIKENDVEKVVKIGDISYTSIKQVSDINATGLEDNTIYVEKDGSIYLYTNGTLYKVPDLYYVITDERKYIGDGNTQEFEVFFDNDVIVYVNNVLQNPSTAYTKDVNGKFIRFNTAPDSNTIITIKGYNLRNREDEHVIFTDHSINVVSNTVIYANPFSEEIYINLPESPKFGDFIKVIDYKGYSDVNNIIIQDPTNTIEGDISYVIKHKKEEVLLIFNGNLWNVISTSIQIQNIQPPLPKQLQAPVIQSSATSATIDDTITLSISSQDSNSSGVEWFISGDFTILSGSTTSNQLTIKGNSNTTIVCKARSVGDLVDYRDSLFSDEITITIQDSTLQQLSAPTASASATSINVDETVTFTASDVDPNATGVQWDITGDYTIQSGSLTSTSVTVVANSEGQLEAKVKAVGDGTTYSDSEYSNTVTVTVNSNSNSEDDGTGSESNSECDPTQYDTSLHDGDSENGVQLTNPDDNVTLYFNSKSYNDAIAPSTGFFDVNGTVIKIDYATEYQDDTFIVDLDGTIYKGTFVDTGTYSNPTKTTVCQ